MNEISPLNITRTEFMQKEKQVLPEKETQQKQTDLRVLNNYKRDLVKPSFRGTKESNPLDKFKVPADLRTYPSHAMYYYMDRRAFSVLKHMINAGYWIQTPYKAEGVSPWKMHIYADTEEDWAKLVLTVGRYLNTQKVDWKTLSSTSPVDDLNSDERQKGKAFTVYTTSQEQFKQLAKDIDYIIRQNGLETEGSKISGDKELGTTGRIFYRYDSKSGALKDKVFHFDNDEEMEEYDEQYDSNRGGDNYLASDMTTDDDPFYNFNPQN